MPRVEIGSEYGEIKLGDQLIQGIYQGMSISGEVMIKEEETPARSGKLKQALGWEDIQVTLNILLKNDEESTPHEKLKRIVALFRKTDKAAKPEVYKIVSRMTDAWGLDKVIIRDIKSDDASNSDTLKVTLNFEEWESPLVKIEARAVQTPTVDRTGSMPSLPSSSSEVDEWQKRPTADTYQDEIVVPDDD